MQTKRVRLCSRRGRAGCRLWIEAPAGPLSSKIVTTPIRTCLGCRQKLARAELVRLAWDAAAAAVVVDARQVLPGRGCYIHPGCAATTARRRVVGRALRQVVDGDQVAAVLAAFAADESA